MICFVFGGQRAFRECGLAEGVERCLLGGGELAALLRQFTCGGGIHSVGHLSLPSVVGKHSCSSAVRSEKNLAQRDGIVVFFVTRAEHQRNGLMLGQFM
jgi:hypothetical protein